MDLENVERLRKLPIGTIFKLYDKFETFFGERIFQGIVDKGKSSLFTNIDYEDNPNSISLPDEGLFHIEIVSLS